jgi:prepilin-type N-terminal cleavage/methylation domain-containing protein
MCVIHTPLRSGRPLSGVRVELTIRNHIMLKTPSPHRPSRLQRGMSLVELMIGMAVGLFVVAGAATVASTQVVENRRLLLETQVQQDLRAAADIITRELRRAGYDSHPEGKVWSAAGGASQPLPNSKAGLVLGQGGDVVTYRYDRPSATPLASFGYRLSNHTIKQRIGATVQDLTDPRTLKVTTFDVVLQAVEAEQLACPELCADGSQDCWPTLAPTDAVVTIAGTAVSDPTVNRTVTSRVRLRNDGVTFNLSATQVCP